ncbi:MAG: InlB B-repeat-containing protein [Bacteroidales bacterium]
MISFLQFDNKLKFSPYTKACMLFLLLFFCTVSQGQLISKNGTPQAPNYDLETWENPEPWGWNSSSCFEAGNSPSKIHQNQSIWKSTLKRPGSKGSFSAQIKVTQSDWFHYKFPFGTTSKELMGSLTTGTLYYYDSKGNDKSCIYTHTGEVSKKWAFNARPDSIVFWAKSERNGDRNSDMSCYLHNDTKLEDRNPNGTAEGSVIGQANAKISYKGGQWQRISRPIQYTTAENPTYLLLSFTAGNNFRETNLDDILYIDDILFIYNPSLRINNNIITSIPRRKGSSYTLNVPFTITGTMSPFNHLPDNEVIVYLSDQNGNFENAQEMGRKTTDESGNINIAIPDNIPSGSNYKLKLVSTNYPLESNIINLDIFYQFQLSISQNNQKGKVNQTNETLREFTPCSAKVLEVFPGNHFVYWKENADSVSADWNFNIVLDRDRSFIGIFDTNYYRINVHTAAGGESFFLNNSDTTLYIVHQGSVKMKATPKFGYHFSQYKKGNTLFHSDASYQFSATQDLDIQAIFDTNSYPIRFSASPDPFGQTTQSGTAKHFTSISSLASPKPYCEFLYWKDSTTGNILGYEPSIKIDMVTGPIAYQAVFKEITHKVSTSTLFSERGNTYGDSIYSAFILTDSAIVKAKANYGYHFQNWSLTIDGIQQSSSINKNPYAFLVQDHIQHDYIFTARFDTNIYTVSVPMHEHGNIKGSGNYLHGKEIRLSAFPDSGYHFVAWKQGATIVSTDTVFSPIALSDLAFTALFEINSYPINISIQNQEFGQVTKPSALSGSYPHFTTLSLEGQAFAGSEFRYWIVNKDTISPNSSFVLNIDEPKDIIAVFTPLRKQIILKAEPSTYGKVFGEGILEHGSSATAIAESNVGYHFAYWLNNHQDTIKNNPLIIPSLQRDTTFTAYFEHNLYRLKLNASIGGKVYINQDTNLSEKDCFYQEEVDICAIVNSNMYRFTAWQDLHGKIVSKENHIRLLTTKDTALIALFELKEYKISTSVNSEKAGYTLGNGIYTHGSKNILYAHPSFGYTFVGWKEGNSWVSHDTAFEFIVTGERFLTAFFTEKEFDLTLMVAPKEAGSAVGSGRYKYNYNTRLEATPKKGYSFSGWQNNKGQIISLLHTYYPTITQSDTIIATFQPTNLQIEWAVKEEGSGYIVEKQKKYTFHCQATAEAIAKNGYHFSHWSNALKETISTENIFAFIPTQDSLFIAHFEPNSYDINALSANMEQGEVRGSGSYSFLQGASLEAISKPNYQFLYWKNKEGRIVSTSTLFKPIVEESTTYTAFFKAVPVNLHLQTWPQGCGTISINGNTVSTLYQGLYKDSVHIKVVVPSGMRFRYCTSALFLRPEETSIVSTNTEFTLPITEENILTAVFDSIDYSVKISVSPALSGNASGQGVYRYGQETPLEALAKEGYTFYAFRNDSSNKIVSFDPNYKLTVTKDLHLTALFLINQYDLQVSSLETEKGSVTGNGRFEYQEEVYINAFPKKGYLFDYWSNEKGDTIAQTAAFTFNLKEYTVLYAHFTPALFELKTAVSDPNGGYVEGAGIYPYQTTTYLKAFSKEGFHFSGWKEYKHFLLETDSVLKVDLDQNRSLEAVFERNIYTITAHKEVPVLTFYEEDNDNDDNNDNETNEDTDEPNKSKSAKAPILFSENIGIFGDGSYYYGEKVCLEVFDIPSSYLFVAWVNDKNDTLSKEEFYTFAIRESLNLRAIFKANSHEITLEAIPVQAGSVSGNGVYLHGQKAVLSSVPSSNQYVFEGWTMNGELLSTSSVYKHRVNSSNKITAQFRENTFDVEIRSNIEEGGVTTGSGNYLYQHSVNIRAIAKPGYEFLYWSQDTSILSKEPEYTFLVENSSVLIANFKLSNYQIHLNATPKQAANLSGAGSYTYKDTVFLSTQSSDAYKFLYWICQNDTLSTETSFSFLPTKNMDIQACFISRYCNVNTEAYPLTGGSVKGNGNFSLGDSVCLTAIPSEDYFFDQWVNDKMETVGNNLQFKFIAQADVHYTALFAKKTENNTEDEKEISIYPNPFHSELNIVGNNIDRILIFNALGQLIGSNKIENTITTVTTTNLANGIYHYRIIRKNGKIVNGKLIKY